MNIIAEIGINHGGSLETAFSLMKMSKDCGADFVKFQKRDIETVYTKEFLDSPRESPWGKTQGDLKRRLEFNEEQYREIDSYSKKIAFPWTASCWDLKSLDFIESFNPPFHKIASPMLTNRSFLAVVASKGRFTLISTGMSNWKDINLAMQIFNDRGCPFVLMHCVSEYPTLDEVCNLSMIPALREGFPGRVGYSNHSPGILPCIGAAFLGATWIEVHITLDRSSYGSDQAASIEEPGLRRLVQYCKLAPILMGSGVKNITEKEKENAKKMRYFEHG